MKINKPFAIFVLILLLCVPLKAQDVPQAEILWDTWGVPHIFAADNIGLFYAFGYAQAQNHGDLILRLYGESRGRAAEYWGERYLEGDIQWRTVGLQLQAQSAYESLSPEWRSYLDAFTAGFNTYVGENLDKIADEREIAYPIQAVDVIAHGIRMGRYEFVSRTGFGIARDWANGSPQAEQTEPSSGSNAWAIGPSRSASGNAMLVANPHQPWVDQGLWIEAHWVTPDLNLYGAALVGTPMLEIAFNDYLGWTHTVNTHDGWDLYRLTLQDDGYLFDGKILPFDTHEETVLVKAEDGTITEQTITIRASVHGPVLTEKDGEALALRVVAENAFESTIEWWEMAHARNLAEFEAAISNIRIPMFTIMYADRDGNIMMVFNELVPKREEGDWAFWSNITSLDSSNPAIIPGDTSRYLWAYEYHTYEELPRLVNPDTGWLQNANEPPWTATLPLALDREDYPAYMAPAPYVWGRPVMSMRMLYEDDSITFDELLAYKQSTKAELADDLLDDLIAAARETAETSENERLSQAADILEQWDRTTDADSVGAALFTLWVIDYVMPTGIKIYAVPWDINDPFDTPSGLADPDAAVASLLRVANQLEALRLLGGGIDVPYGNVFRLRWGEYDLPANGSYDHLGTFRILTFIPDPDLRLRPIHGDSYIAVLEFGEEIRAKVLLSYGNSTQPGSPHMGDQLELFSRKELRDAWRSREDIEANLEDRTIFKEVVLP